MVTAERVRELLEYCEETGRFTWRIANSRAIKAGAIAGSLSCGYRNISIDGVLYRAHRLAWLYVRGEWPNAEIDHINLNKDDNRLSNLRIASRSQNMANSRVRVKCKSGFKGVSKYRGRWVASIGRNGRKTHIGVFDTPEEANAAYERAALSIHGEFARAA
jgi:hypothetical protein